MTDTLKNKPKAEKHDFLGSSVEFTPNPNPNARKKWVVNLGRNWTKLKGIYHENREVKRTKSFDNKNECHAYLKHLEREYRNTDLSISTDDKRDFINAREALDSAGRSDLTVTDAIKKWLQHQPKTNTNKTVAECWAEFMDHKITVDQIKPDTVSSLHECAWKSLEPFLDLPITDFEQPNVRAKLREFIQRTWTKPTTRNHHMVKTKEFFNYLIELDEAPLSRNPLPRKTGFNWKKHRKPPKIVTVEQTEQILQVARETDEELGMLAFWIITLFLGCRPKSEMTLMTWDDIHLNEPDDSFLMVSDESKTGQRRVEIYPQVYEWLMLCDRSKPIFKWGVSRKTGKPAPSMEWYKKSRSLILLKAGILKQEMTKEEKKEWADFQRHTCASCMWRAEDFRLATIVNQLGHGIETSKDYYLNTALSKADAKRFWQIRPSTVSEKIVKIA
jgi:integrase